MMLLPSETPPSSTAAAVTALLATLGAGGLLKLYTQWQAGRTSIRAEMQTRVHALEQTVALLQKEIGDLREERGRLTAERASMREEIADLRKQLSERNAGA